MLRCCRSSHLARLYSTNQQNLNCRNINYHINDIEKSVEINIPNGRPLILSTGRFASLAQGVGVCTSGGTTVLSTAASQYQPNVSSDLQFVASCRFKNAAIGQITPNFGRYDVGYMQTNAIISRLLHRSLRPLFPAHYNHDTQVACSVLAAHAIHDPEVLGINAASLALATSDIPWDGPVGAVRVGLIGNEFYLNPTQEQLEEASVDLIIVGNGIDSVVAIDGQAKIVSNTIVNAAIKFGLESCDTIAEAIDALARKFGKTKRHYNQPCSIDEQIIKTIRQQSELPLTKLFKDHSHNHRSSRTVPLNRIRTEITNKVSSMHPEIDSAIITAEYDKIVKETFRRNMLDGKRCDGRRHDEIRPIKCSVHLEEPAHGSAIFARGGSQVRSMVAFGPAEKKIFMQPLKKPQSKRFNLLHSLPSHAVRRLDPERKDVGDGHLAENALLPIIPAEYQYSIKLTSNVLAADGSSSMATVCGGSLALLDAGVPINNPVAGIAIGIITRYDSNDPKKLRDYRILTDITSIEDSVGDLDMKVTSTTDGITAIQAGMKINGLPLTIINECIARAQTANQQILKKMQMVCAVPREQQKPCWPAIMELSTKPSHEYFFRKSLLEIGRIHKATGIYITKVEQNTFKIFAPSQSKATVLAETISKLQKALEVPSFEIGSVYPAKVVHMSKSGVEVKLYETMMPQFIENDLLDFRCFGHPKYLGLEVGKEFNVRYFGVNDDGTFRLLCAEHRMNTDDEFVELLEKFKDDPEFKKIY